MTDWTAGYVADVGYTFGYYGELNPLRSRLAFAHQGLVAPSVATACELGFGQGLSANIHAAASSATWWGTDFNPSQTAFAQSLAAAAGGHARLFDQSFSEFCARIDLPDFDFIGLHGIWSWISDENRKCIVDFVSRKLKVGGILYVSYNTFPGWALFAPMRHLMVEHAEVLGTEGRGILNRVDGAIEFAERLLATNPSYSKSNPLVAERLKSIQRLNRHYLAHEYFNRDWDPMHFATMAKWLEPAKLQYACSANHIDAIPQVNFTAAQRAFLAEIPDPMFHQSVSDFMVNQQFRKDYWIKGARRLSALEKREALADECVVLMTPRDSVPLKVVANAGEANLSPGIYNPILDLLADYQPRSLASIEKAVAKDGINFAQVLQSIMVLSGAGHVVAAQAESKRVVTASKALNTFLMDKARGSADVGFLASPVTGGGVPASQVQQLFLLSLQKGKKTTGDWARDAATSLHMQGQRIVKDGAPLETIEENIAELQRQATVFAERDLPIFKALGIA